MVSIRIRVSIRVSISVSIRVSIRVVSGLGLVLGLVLELVLGLGLVLELVLGLRLRLGLIFRIRIRRDVCRDGTLNGISPCMYISLICPVPFIWKEFLSYKHIVPLCRDDIMLTLQIVPGEIVPGRNILM